MAKKPGFLDVVKGLTQKKSSKDKEVEKYEKILEEQPDDRNALNALGDLYAKRGDAEKACTYYLNVGSLYARDGFTLKAIAVYKKAQRARPDQISTYLELADLYVQKGLIGEAKANYLSAAEKQATAGEKRESLDTYRKIADLDPSNLKIRTKLAAMYESEQFMEDAALIYVDIGEVVLREDVDTAKTHFERALELHGDNEETLSRIGYAYAEQGFSKEATPIFQKLRERFPDDLDYKEQLEMLSGGGTPTAPQSAAAHTSMPAIDFDENELGSLNFGDEDVSTDGNTLDFQIEEQGEIVWDSTAGQEELSSGPAENAASEKHTLEFEPGNEISPPSSGPQQSQKANGSFFDLASKLDASIDFSPGTGPQTSGKSPGLKVQAPEQLATSEIGDIVKEFKQGVLDEVGTEDYETHYELGISYKEMALLDDAIEELRLASLEPSKFVECQGVIALCYAEKGDYASAVQSLEEARSRVNAEEERYQDLTYQIGTLYEQAGRTSEAAQTFQELYQLKPSYRDVRTRLNKLLA
ncbi:hypothetical protein CSB45_06385 [candidate division KSB3 bacterium]|uniref:Tetratricopeptide repeat protein n=1 Tax=candidate division KSB3 bacterium TaxID=2044937 RepID=A0A2G6E716_9BACT|nr:MAG: hypothetical protein CSB45_06385 [candidate division KSB3 bacterium]PIE30271.1 MAG: hypothetical protein CSA57_05100 [candidate division KSB3 bacterium]